MSDSWQSGAVLHRAILSSGVDEVTLIETVGMEHHHRMMVQLRVHEWGMRINLTGYLSYKEAKAVFARAVLLDDEKLIRKEDFTG